MQIIETNITAANKTIYLTNEKSYIFFFERAFYLKMF